MTANQKPIRVFSEGDQETEYEIRRMHIERVRFWATYLPIVFLLALCATSGILVGTNVWLSWIWALPVIALVAPFIYDVVRPKRYRHLKKRRLLFLLAPALLFVGFFLVIFSGYADDVWAQIIGNEAMGARGWQLGVIGVVLNFVLAYIIPAALFVWVVKATFAPRLPVRKVIVLSVLTSLFFIFPIGQSIIVNSGF